MEFLGRGDFAGLFVCLRSQSKPADFADQYGFNTPVREDFQARYGIDIRQEDFDLQAWRDLLGAYLTLFLTELRTELNFRGIRLAVGVPRSDVIGPPMGNTTLDWRRWVTTGTIDEWIPCTGGYGYRQNYISGNGLLLLQDHLDTIYAPILGERPVNFYVVRQWDERSAKEEKELTARKVVRGLVFGFFRFDNPGPVACGDWRE